MCWQGRCFPVRIQSTHGDCVGHQQSWHTLQSTRGYRHNYWSSSYHPAMVLIQWSLKASFLKIDLFSLYFHPSYWIFSFIAMTNLLVFHRRYDKINQKCKPLLQYQLWCGQPEFTAGLTGWNLVACNMYRADSPMTSLPLSIGNLWALSWPLDHPSLPLLVLYFLSYSFKTLFGPRLFFTSHTLSLISNMEGKLFKNRLHHRQRSGN